MKGIILLICAISFLYAAEVNASGKHHPQEQSVNDYSVTNQYNSQAAIASALAGVEFGVSINALQVGCAYSDDDFNQATACGAAKRLCFGTSCGLINFKAGRSTNGGESYVFGGTWVFK